MPIVVGGTNYYIESLLWKVLIGDGVQREHIRRRNADSDVDTDADSDVEADAESPKRPKSGAGSGSAVAAGQERIQNPTPKPAPAPEQQVSDLLERCRAGTVSVDQLESYDSPLLHKVLAVVDQPSANRLHPNNKRKIIR